MDENTEEEIDFNGDNPIFAYCFAIMEYLKGIDADLYEKACEYAEDLTGIRITDFDLYEIDNDKLDTTPSEDIDENEDEDEETFDD